MADTSQLVGRSGLPPHDTTTSYNPKAGATFPPGTVLRSSFTTPGEVVPAQADSLNHTRAVAIAGIPGVEGEAVISKFVGPLTLTTDQWDQITEGSGGLILNRQYFLSDDSEGHLLDNIPSTSGSFIVPIGTALSPQTLMIQIGAPTEI